MSHFSARRHSAAGFAMVAFVAAGLLLASCGKKSSNDYTYTMGTKTLSFTIHNAKGEVVIHQPVFSGNVELTRWMNTRVDSSIQHLAGNFKNVLLQIPEGATETFPINGHIATAAPEVVSLFFQDSCTQLQETGKYFNTLNLDLVNKKTLDLRDLVTDDKVFLKMVSDSVRMTLIRMHRATMIEQMPEGATEPTLKDAAQDLMKNPTFEFETSSKFDKFHSWYVANGVLYIMFDTATILGASFGGVEKIPFPLASFQSMLRASPAVQALQAK